jgi:hypothetical protein
MRPLYPYAQREKELLGRAFRMGVSVSIPRSEAGWSQLRSHVEMAESRS